MARKMYSESGVRYNSSRNWTVELIKGKFVNELSFPGWRTVLVGLIEILFPSVYLW